MDLISIFSFLKEHLYDGGFIQMKLKQPPTTVWEWYSLYEKEFGEMTTNLYAYMQQYGVTEKDKLVLQNLLNTYLSKTDDDFYKVISKDEVRNNNEQKEIEIEEGIDKHELTPKYTNIIRSYLHDFNNDIIDDIERYLKVANKQETKPILSTEPPTTEENKIIIVPKLNSLPKLTGIPHTPKQNSFVDYFYHPKKEILVPMLKEEFIKDKGKTIKILIEILVEEKILALESGEFKRFYSSMKDYFGADIGTYQSINDYVVNKTKHTKAYDAVKIRIDYILKNVA